MRLLICCAASRCPTFRTSTFYISCYFTIPTAHSEALPTVSTFQLDLTIRTPISIGFPIKPHWLPIPPTAHPTAHLAPPIKSKHSRSSMKLPRFSPRGTSPEVDLGPPRLAEKPPGPLDLARGIAQDSRPLTAQGAEEGGAAKSFFPVFLRSPSVIATISRAR